MTKKQLVERIKLEIELTEEEGLGTKEWPREYCWAYLDGLKRALELSDPNN